MLNGSGMATLLFDLLTPEEERDRVNVFNIELLARRPGRRYRLAGRRTRHRCAAVGYFGASTGAGAALRAAADPAVTVRAVVSRGGRPDLAGESLTKVHAPTSLNVGDATTSSSS